MILRFPVSSRASFRLLTGVLLMGAVLTAADRSVALQPHDRDGWQLGISYGAATGKVTGPGIDAVEFEDGVTPHIRLAHALGDHFGLGLAYTGWMYETGEVPLKHRLSLQNVMLSLNWYPGRPDRATGGLCVRASAGLGWLGYADVEIVENEEQGHGDRQEFTGVAVEVNVSYEFRLTRTAAAGLGFGFNNMALQADEVDGARFYPLTFNLGWYWD